MTEKKALILMGRAYEVMENSWLSAGETGRLFTAGGVLAKEAIRAMEALQSKMHRVRTCALTRHVDGRLRLAAALSYVVHFVCVFGRF